MKLIKVAAGELNQTPLDWAGNRARILEAIAAARSECIGLLCLPELCITGYGCEDAFGSAGVVDRAWRVLEEIVPETRSLAVSLGLPVLHQNALFDGAALVVDGKIVGLVAKRHLAGEGIHYEPRWFKPWPAGVAAVHRADGGAEVPIGDLHFDVGGVGIGFEICEDAWAARRPGVDLAGQGIDVILNPSGSHFAFGKLAVRRRFVLEGSRAFGVTYVYSNLLGNEAGRAIYDGGALIASSGRIVAAGPRFSASDWRLTSAVVDLDLTRMNQARTPTLCPDLAGNRGGRITADFDWPGCEPEPPAAPLPDWETSLALKEEEFTRAVGLGLLDYLRKSRSHGFVVSLSGGADSSAVACLVATMVRLALAELGPAGLADRLAYIPAVQGKTEAKDIVRSLLTCVYQATSNSSQATRDAAATVADAIGAKFIELDVDSLNSGYVELVGRALGRRLGWDTDDIALQNIQARVRGPGVWMIANIRNALLLATSNRSEAAVGYATMDGDTCGGLSPIAGIDKAFLRQWLAWMEKSGPAGSGAIPELACVNRLTPTAELRPPDAAQTDEDDLMPYPLLDAVELAAIRDKQTPVEVFRLMRLRFPDYSPEQLAEWIERFFRLWARNQWKRERYAPSFHLDDRNLDPKTWCRFPILSGGFEAELSDLQAVAVEPS